MTKSVAASSSRSSNSASKPKAAASSSSSLIHLIVKLITFGIYIVTLPYRLFVHFKRSSQRASKNHQKSVNLTLDRPAASFGKYLTGSKVYESSPEGSYLHPLASEGIGSVAPVTVMEGFKLAVQRHGDKPALHWQADTKSPFKASPFKTWTWRAYYEDTLKAARAFVHLGLQPFETVNILGFNSPQWFIGNLGAIFAGGKVAGIYATDQEKSCLYKAQHSKARVVIVESVRHLQRYVNIEDDIVSTVSAIIIYGEDKPADYQGKIDLYAWDEFLALGDKVEQSEVDKRMEDQTPGQCCTLIYTSGTTGNPKAVMVSHDNLTWTAKMIMTEIPNMCDQPEYFVSYLPLSHVAAQMLDIHGPIMASATYRSHCEVFFARPDALRGTLRDTLVYARPTMFFGVPRVWEKFREAILSKARTGLLNDVAQWAKHVAFEKFLTDQFANTADPPLSYPIAKKLLGRVRIALGLDRCRYCISGAAPIRPLILSYFASIDLPVHQVYGMSECTGPATLDHPRHSRLGSVGSGLPGVELKIDHIPSRDASGEGEICYRGRNVMMGYMGNEEKTKESIDENGWLHSGDVGKLDENGFLFITGRIKEILITAGGENIAPVPIENQVKEHLPAVSNVMLICDHKKFVSCLLTLQTEQDPDTERFTSQLTGEALKVDSEASSVQQAKQSTKWKEYIQQGIDKYNTGAVSRAQMIREWRILDEDFSTAAGDLTATLKLRRAIVTKKQQKIIDSIYPHED